VDGLLVHTWCPSFGNPSNKCQTALILLPELKSPQFLPSIIKMIHGQAIHYAGDIYLSNDFVLSLPELTEHFFTESL
jgi:hypothetical protein